MIIFLYGEDSFRANRFLQASKNKFINEQDQLASSIELVDGEIVDLEKINQLISTGSLFTEKRLIVIKNIFKNKKDSLFTLLLNILEKIKQSNEIIVIIKEENLLKNKLSTEAKKLFNFLNKGPYAQEFKLLGGNSLLKFINLEAKKYHKTISHEAALELIKRLGSDMWQLVTVIKQAALLSQDKEINQENIINLSQENFVENIFALTDAISENKTTLAIKILEEQYEAGLSEAYILNMLIRQFKLLLLSKNFLNTHPNKNLATTLKLHPFVAKKLKQQINNFTYKQLLFYFNSLLKLNKEEKHNTKLSRAKLNLLLN